MWKFPQTDRHKIHTISIGENWKGMRKLVENDSRFAWRNEVLRIVDSRADNDVKMAKIRALGGGEAYHYLLANILPCLRTAVVCQIFFKNPEPPAPAPAPEPPPPLPVPEPAPEPEPTPVVEDTTPIRIHSASLTPIPSAVTLEQIRKPLFAIKTNLIFDAASMLNVELEVPIGNKWSVAGEWIFPWWLWSSKQYCLQMLHGTVEGRYWLGDRTNRPQLTGWFGGIHAGGGYYDFEWGNRGYQGEFWDAGISGGYAHTIGKSRDWRMEYALGLGWMGMKYRQYDPRYGIDDRWHLIRQVSGKYTWAGPTRAKISLVYLIHYSRKKEVRNE